MKKQERRIQIVLVFDGENEVHSYKLYREWRGAGAAAELCFLCLARLWTRRRCQHGVEHAGLGVDTQADSPHHRPPHPRKPRNIVSFHTER